MLEAESHLLGRVTYESFAGAWPEREGPFADKMNSMPKYVVSSTLEDPLEWNNSIVIKGDLAEQIGKLKEQSGGPILVAGSATLLHFLIENDLVDELRLMVFPVMIGGGKRPFPESQQRKVVSGRPAPRRSARALPSTRTSRHSGLAVSVRPASYRRGRWPRSPKSSR